MYLTLTYFYILFRLRESHVRELLKFNIMEVV